MFTISNNSNERITHAIESLNMIKPKFTPTYVSASPRSDCKYYCSDECMHSCEDTCYSWGMP